MPSLGLRTRKSAGVSSLRVPTGVWNVLAGAAYNRVLNCGSPQTQGESKLVERTLLPLQDFSIMVPRVGDGDPSFPVHPAAVNWQIAYKLLLYGVMHKMVWSVHQRLYISFRWINNYFLQFYDSNLVEDKIHLIKVYLLETLLYNRGSKE